MIRLASMLFLGGILTAQTTPGALSVVDLQIFFQRQCSKCHGLDGSATGPDGKRLKGRDFTSPSEMKGTTETGLAKTIRNGIFFGKVMPAFKLELSEGDTHTLVREIVRKAVKGKPIAPQADTLPVAPPPPLPPDPKGNDR